MNKENCRYFSGRDGLCYTQLCSCVNQFFGIEECDEKDCLKDNEPLEFINTIYKTIVIDPPWNVEQGSKWKTRFTDKARPQKHYKTMTLEELKKIELPIDRQAHIYIWVVNQHVDWGYELARHWGLNVIQFFTWCKDGLGVGQFQCNSEHILVCRKGSRHGNPFGKSGGTYFNWRRGRHSEKPDEFYSLVEKISPGPYLDMFARRERKGWDVFGNEVENSIQLTPQGAAVGQRSVGTNAEAGAFNCVSSESLVYNRPCKEWCGNTYCKSEAPSGGHL